MKKIILFLGLFFVFVPFVFGYDFSNWEDKISIKVSNNYAINMSPVSVRVNLADYMFFNQSRFKNDGSDVRVADFNDNLINSFVEEWNPDQNKTIIWFEGRIPPNSSVNYKIYHNNPVASSYSDSSFMIVEEGFEGSGTPSGWSVEYGGFDSSTHYTGSESAHWSSTTADYLGIAPPIPNQGTNYTFDFYYYTGNARAPPWNENYVTLFYWHDSVAGDLRPGVVCSNSSGINIGSLGAFPNTWVRLVVDRQRLNNKIRFRTYVNEELKVECNGTTSPTAYGTSQGAKTWAFRSGQSGGSAHGTVYIDNYKIYRNYGYNTDLDISYNLNVTITSISLSEEKPYFNELFQVNVSTLGYSEHIFIADNSTGIYRNITNISCFSNNCEAIFNITAKKGDISIMSTAVVGSYAHQAFYTYSSIPRFASVMSYNLSTPTGDCTSWPSGNCMTTDTTPSVMISTDKNSSCMIGLENKNFSYYESQGVDRLCTGNGTIEHICTLNSADELTEEYNSIYVSCIDLVGNENSTSTSGPLTVYIPVNDLENYGVSMIESGITHALSGNSYTMYSDQKLYARNSANSQKVGVFDRVVKWMNKIWAFNYITGNETKVGMFNITPTFYALEMSNMTVAEINSSVYNLIMNTK